MVMLWMSMGSISRASLTYGSQPSRTIVLPTRMV